MSVLPRFFVSAVLTISLISIQFFSTVVFASSYPKEKSISQDKSTLPQAPYISVEEIKNWLKEGRKVLFVDVRTPREYKKGHIEDALNVPYERVEKYARKWDREKTIIFYCIHSSWRAPYAANVLADMGFKNVYILEGGITAWRGGGQTLKASRSTEKPQIVPYPKDLRITFVHPQDAVYQGTIVLTEEELRYFDGKNGRPAFVAVQGVIYDVTQSRLWRGGEHAPRRGEISAGRDLTEAIKDSPHGVKELDKFPLVGRLVEIGTE